MHSCCRCMVGLAASKGGGVHFLCTFRPAGDTLRSSAEERAFTGRHSRYNGLGDPPLAMLGTVVKQVKSHPALIPLFIFIGGGATMSVMYLCRLALKNPDVSWDRKNNPEPWNKMEPDQQYKLFTVNMDYSKLKKDRPDF